MPDEKLNPSSPKNQNLAASLSEEERKKIAKMVCDWWRTDKDGRRDWETRRNEWYKLWLMHREPKTEPWPGASNVCLPLIAIACNQFHARSYSAMFSAPGVVKCMPVVGNDVARAEKCEKFMDWQVLNDIPDYEDEKDKLLLSVPINGSAFTKGYWDEKGERPIFEYASAMNVLLPYRTKNLQTARRITHEIWLHYDELGARNRIKDGFYVDFEKVSETPGDEPEEEIDLTKDKVETEADSTIERPKRVLETHGWWAKGTASPKPVIFTVDFDSQTLLRMTSREVRGEVMNHWTDYHFLPNPEGYYSFGFGHFLKNLNEMANTAFNQIFDAGRISNQPFGFYGRRAGLKRKEIKLWPGMMQEVEDAGQVFFPSMQRVDQVLFQVLGLIQQYCEQFTSTSDYLLGREAKGTKTPTATGTTAIIEQGLMLYSVMIKRLFRSLKKELGLHFSMNSLYLPEKKQYRVLGEDGEMAFPEIKRSEFQGKLDVVPVADPSYASKLTRRQEAMELYQFAITNPLIVAQPNVQVVNQKALLAISKEVVETYAHQNLTGIIPEPPPEPMSPLAENALFMQGDTHDPMPGENHAEHFKAHYTFAAGPIFPTMPAEYQDNLKDHMRKTQALMYMEAENAKAMGANASGTPTGPSPAPVGPAQPVPADGPPSPAAVAAPAGPSPAPMEAAVA